MFSDEVIDYTSTVQRITQWEAWERQLPGDSQGFKARTNFTQAPPSDTPYDCSQSECLDSLIAESRSYANTYNIKPVSTGPFRDIQGRRYLKHVKYGDLMYDCVVANYRFDDAAEFKATKFGITESEFNGYVEQFIKAIHYRLEVDVEQAA